MSSDSSKSATSERADRYELVERIAVGGMAEVFKAKTYGAHGFEKVLAIKRILPDFATDAEFERRFIAEAKIAVTLNHANIVQILDFSRFGDSLYIVMEFIDGPDLAAVLDASHERGEPIPLGAALHIAVELFKGLDFAHRRGVIHRDISPSNVLISRDGEVKIADFGIAQSGSLTHEGAFRIVGKWPYMSPEQTRGEALDYRSDMFSAAAVVYELFTGKRLFNGNSAEEVVERVRAARVAPASSLRPDLPTELEAILNSLLVARREDRTIRADVVARKLVELSYQAAIPATAIDAADVISSWVGGELASAAGSGELPTSAQLIDQIINSELGRGDADSARRTRVTVTNDDGAFGLGTDRRTVAPGEGAAQSFEGTDARTVVEIPTGSTRRDVDGDMHRQTIFTVVRNSSDDTPAQWALEPLPAGQVPHPPTAVAVDERSSWMGRALTSFKRSRVRVTAVAAATLVTVAGGWGVGMALRDGETTPARAIAPILSDGQQVPVVALLPFQVSAQHPDLDFAASGLPQLLGRQLDRADSVDVLGYYRLLENVTSEGAAVSEWEEAAERLGAEILVRGTIVDSDQGLSVTVRVERGTGEVLGELQRTATVESLPGVVRSAAGEVLRMAAGSDDELASGEGPSFAAERHFQLGIAALERDRFDEASKHLEKALAIDDGFNEARYRLALATWWSSVNIPEVLDHIEKALAGELRDEQRTFLLALRTLAINDFPDAIEGFRRAAEQYPDNREVLYGLFEALYHGGYPAESMEVYRRIREMSPGFRLGIMHPLSFYLLRGDEKGLAWALANLHSDSRNRFWNIRARIARRDYQGAIRLIDSIEDGLAGPIKDNERANLESERATIMAVTGRAELALAQIESLKVNHADLAGWALGVAMGDAKIAAEYRPAVVERIDEGVDKGGYWTADALQLVVPLSVLSPGADEAAGRLGPELDKIDDVFSRMMGVEQLRVLLAANGYQSERLAGFAADSPYPVVRLMAQGVTAERAGDSAAAVSFWEASLRHESSARYRLIQYHGLARSARAAGDWDRVVETCDEVIRPRLFDWIWGAVVGDCLLWTGQAQAERGNLDQARDSLQTLISLRARAGDRDALVQAARDRLAALR